MSKQQAHLINKARQALDPLNKTEKQPRRTKVPTRTSIDAMAAPRHIRGGSKLLADIATLQTRNMTDEELVAEVTRRKLGARVNTELPYAKNRKKAKKKKKTWRPQGPIDATRSMSPSPSKSKAAPSPQGSRASFGNIDNNDSASDVHESSLLGLIGAEQQDNEPTTKSPYTLDFEPFYFESHQLEELKRQEDEAVTFDPSEVDTMDQYMFASNDMVQQKENPDRWSPQVPLNHGKPSRCGRV